jgi:peptide methionine sulfoxide reductase MsrA
MDTAAVAAAAAGTDALPLTTETTALAFDAAASVVDGAAPAAAPGAGGDTPQHGEQPDASSASPAPPLPAAAAIEAHAGTGAPAPAAAPAAAAAATSATATTATATLSLGCFWNPDLAFSRLRGVRSVLCGYTGGAKPPKGTNYGDNVESVQVTYDPSVLSWEELMVVFWREQDAADATRRRKYASVIWYADVRERARAEATIKAAKAAAAPSAAQQQKKTTATVRGGAGGATAAGASQRRSSGGGTILTTAEKLGAFWTAPDKHQK